jgi:hypothetical protein
MEEIMSDTHSKAEQLTINDTLNKAVLYANLHYYSKPMTQFNPGKMNPMPLLPPMHLFTHPLKQLKTCSGFETPVRPSHGLLHVLGAMELIDGIRDQYDKVKTYGASEKMICDTLDISSEELFKFIKLAALFHDSGRQGDGIDRWDPQSAENFRNYLRQELKVDENICELFASTIEYKDDRAAFFLKARALYGEEFAQHADYLRQLVNMADTIEVLRCRNLFDPSYMPLTKEIEPNLFEKEVLSTALDLTRQLKNNHQDSEEIVKNFISHQINQYRVQFNKNPDLLNNIEAFAESELKEKLQQCEKPQVNGQVNDLIENLIIPHRQKIVNEGRLTCSAHVAYPGFKDKYQGVSSGFKFDKMAERAEELFDQYQLSSYQNDSYIDIDKAAEQAKSAIEVYKKSYKSKGFQLMHNGVFSPRYHGSKGNMRAQRLQSLLAKAENQTQKAFVLYAIAANYEGQTLRDEVYRAMGNNSRDKMVSSLKDYLKENLLPHQDSNVGEKLDTSQLNNVVKQIVDYAEGRINKEPTLEFNQELSNSLISSL